jgi:uncharacterized protein (DUF58 family)
MQAYARYLRPEAIGRLRGLELRARGAVSGVLSGMHRSIYEGQSVEFAQHRPYVAGDDIRHIDWRLFGRKDRFFIRQHEAESNLHCNFLLDVSGSMAYGSGARSKFEYACELTATLAYLVIHQNDAAGLITFDRDVRAKLAATTGKPQLNNLLGILETTRPAGATGVKILFHRLADELRERSLAVLVSDLLADAGDIVSGLEHLCYSGHELVVFHVMDDDEWNFPFVENVLFEGLEDDLRLLTDPQSLRESYLRAVDRFSNRVRAVCLKHRADYVAVNTREALEAVLAGYLSRRAGTGGGPIASRPEGTPGARP